MPARRVKGNSALFMCVLFVLVGLGIALGVYVVYNVQNSQRDKESNAENKVCLSATEYAKLTNLATAPRHQPPQPQPALVQSTPVQSPPVQSPPSPKVRDYKVLNDPLYPPLNRTDAVTHTMLETNIQNRNMYVPTNDTHDSFRLVGYLVNKDSEQDAGGNRWKLLARQKDRNTSEFYLVPSNNNYDIKIAVTADIVIGERLRDIYTIPSTISFKSPLLNPSPYEFVEIPKSDLTTSRYL